MSLLLSWETPPELYDALQSAVVAKLTRIFPEALDVTGQVVEETLPWGFYEDTGTNDPLVKYTIEFTTQSGSKSIVITDDQIRRWVRPENSCRIDFTFSRPDTAPWAGRRIKLMDMPGQGWVRDLWMNLKGQAHIVLAYGTVARLEIEGINQALEFAVPHTPTLYWRELQETGTWLRLDERSVR